MYPNYRHLWLYILMCVSAGGCLGLCAEATLCIREGEPDIRIHGGGLFIKIKNCKPSS